MDPESSDDEEDNSDSDSDEGEEQVAAHDPNSQARQRLPIYHPGFQLTEEITQRILDIFLRFITASIQQGYEDDEAQRLRNEIIRKKTVNYQDAVRLAVAGDTGVGKSALLNALLGVLNLTIEVCQVPTVDDAATDKACRVIPVVHVPALSPSFANRSRHTQPHTLRRSSFSVWKCASSWSRTCFRNGSLSSRNRDRTQTKSTITSSPKCQQLATASRICLRNNWSLAAPSCSWAPQHQPKILKF